MRLRPFVVSSIIVLALIASHRAEASAILFTDRGEFDAALDGDYQLFTEFPITDFSLISGTIGIGDYGGLRFVGDFQFHILFFQSALTSSPLALGNSLVPSLTQQITAIGFDLVASNLFLRNPNGFTFDFSSPIATDALFTLGTTNGLVVQTTLAPATFFGVVLIDDVFSRLGWAAGSSPVCLVSVCSSSVSSDNLAVQSVPEPATALLVLTGAMMLLQRRRFMRWK